VLAEASKVVPEVNIAGSKPSGLPSEQYTRVLPAAKAWPDNAMLLASKEIAIRLCFTFHSIQ